MKRNETIINQEACSEEERKGRGDRERKDVTRAGRNERTNERTKGGREGWRKQARKKARKEGRKERGKGKKELQYLHELNSVFSYRFTA